MAGFEGGSRFPFIDLEKALGRAKELYDADQRGNEMPVSGAFGVWGYSAKSSGGFQTVAALKMYGLLEDAGSKEARKLKLTKHALDYFRDEREELREDRLKAFATNPSLFHALFNRHWGAEVPNDAIARSLLKVDGELNEQSARAALGIYKENMAFAKLKGCAKIGEMVHPSVEKGAAKIGDYVQWTSSGQDQFRAPRKVVWVAEDGNHIRVHGSNTGIPMAEVTIVETPKPPAAANLSAAASSATGQRAEPRDISVLMVGDRLEITANVDADGLTKLKQMLDKYEEILKLLQ